MPLVFGPSDGMQPIAVVRERHEADEHAVAHPRLSLAVGEEQEVVGRDRQRLARHLRPPAATLLDGQARGCLARGAAVGIEGDGERAVGQPRHLPRRVHGDGAVDGEAFLFHAAKIPIIPMERKDNPHPSVPYVVAPPRPPPATTKKAPNLTAQGFQK